MVAKSKKIAQVTEATEVAAPEQKAPREKKTKFVVQVGGTGMGRARYVTPAMTLDPWRFHADQFETREQAQALVDKVKEELGGDLTIKIVPFVGAWYESPEVEQENAAKVAANKKKPSKKAATPQVEQAASPAM